MLTANLRGIFWLMLSLPCFQLMNVLLRHVAGELPVVETVFLRNLFGFLVLLPWLLRTGTGAFHTRRPGVHLVRAACHVGGISLWVWALTLIPMASAQALNFTSPLFVVIGAILFMGERSDRQRWISVAVGFAGALIVIRPGFGEISPGVLAVLGSAVLIAGSKMLTKVATRSDSVFTTVLYFNLLMAALSLAPALFVWQTPSLDHLALLLVCAIVGALAHVALTQAVRHADLTALQPFEFGALLWAAGFGFVIFAEVPDVWAFVGGAVIVLGASAVARAEARARPVIRAPSGPGGQTP